MLSRLEAGLWSLWEFIDFLFTPTTRVHPFSISAETLGCLPGLLSLVDPELCLFFPFILKLLELCSAFSFCAAAWNLVSALRGKWCWVTVSSLYTSFLSRIWGASNPSCLGIPLMFSKRFFNFISERDGQQQASSLLPKVENPILPPLIKIWHAALKTVHIPVPAKGTAEPPGQTHGISTHSLKLSQQLRFREVSSG